MKRSTSKRAAHGHDETAVGANNASGSEAPTYKRRRIALACTSCRNRKSRCNGAKPSCSLCIQLGFRCTYEQPANLQGQPVTCSSDGYEARLSSIEDTLKLLLNQQNAAQRQQHERRDALQGDSAAPMVESSDIAILGGNEVDLLDESEDSVDGMATIGDFVGKDVRYFGPSSNIALLGQISDLLAAIKHSKEGNQKGVGSNSRLVSRMPSPKISPLAPTPQIQPSASPCALPSEANAMKMIEGFFLNTGLFFPFISKEHIVHTYQEAKATRFRNVRRSWLCLLSTIFAFATFTNISGLQNMERNIRESKIYFNRAQDLLAESHLRLADLEVVQCLVLMSQYRQGTQRSDETWSLHGLAVHAAMQIGLHCFRDEEGMDESYAEIRRRTWFACLLSDSILSMTLGRPPSIPREYEQVDLPRLVSGLSGAKFQGIDSLCFFVATIKLYAIQKNIVAELYGNNLVSRVQLRLEDALPIVLKLEYQLDDWEQNLDHPLKLQPWITTSAVEPPSDSVFERLAVVIRLRHLHTRSMVYRAVLRAFSLHYIRNDPDLVHRVLPIARSLALHILSSCMSTAVEVVKIVNAMSEMPSKLGSGWFSIYYTFHAILVLVNCLLLHYSPCPTFPGVPMMIWSEINITEAAKALVQGKQAIARIGQSTRSSRQICKSLSKMFQICVTIARSSLNDDGPLESLVSDLEATNQNGSGSDAIQPGFVQHDGDFQPFDKELFDFDMQDGFDLLSSFGGFDYRFDELV